MATIRYKMGHLAFSGVPSENGQQSTLRIVFAHGPFELSCSSERIGLSNVMIVEPGPFRTDWAGRSLLESKTVIADYDATAGERRRQSRARSGQQQGDPARGAEAIIAAVESKNPPLHLLLGKPALDMAYKKLEALKKDFDVWRNTTLGADYPEFQ
jgi:hypothetical protein